jgi:3-hydroxybutyryl-CoA dehydratase
LLLETERKIDLGSFDAAPNLVEEYLRSVDDALPIHKETGIVSPLYLAALALGSLLRKLSLPPGAIHSLQEVATLTPVAIGSEVMVSALLEKPRRRSGLEFITAVCTVESGGSAAMTSRTTVLVTSGGPPSGPSEEAQREGDSKEQTVRGIKAAESSLPVVVKEINQQQLNAYAKASGDDNPLHLDPEFATGTQFGGIIAHGMLTLAFVSEMMAAAHGRDWLESGALRVRFKGAAHIGDRLETGGNLAKEQGSSRTYSVGVWNSASGQQLISGAAGFKIKG